MHYEPICETIQYVPAQAPAWDLTLAHPICDHMLVQCTGLRSEATSTAQYVTACRNPDHLVAAISSATGTAAVSNDCVCGGGGGGLAHTHKQQWSLLKQFTTIQPTAHFNNDQERLWMADRWNVCLPLAPSDIHTFYHTQKIQNICDHCGSKLLCTTKTGVFCSVALVYACGFHEKGHTRGRPLHTCVTQCVMDIFSHIGTARVYDLV